MDNPRTLPFVYSKPVQLEQREALFRSYLISDFKNSWRLAAARFPSVAYTLYLQYYLRVKWQLRFWLVPANSDFFACWISCSSKVLNF